MHFRIVTILWLLNDNLNHFDSFKQITINYLGFQKYLLICKLSLELNIFLIC